MVQLSKAFSVQNKVLNCNENLFGWIQNLYQLLQTIEHYKLLENSIRFLDLL